MPKIFHCDCGRVLRADGDDEIVALAQQHAREAHGLAFTRDQVLAVAVPE